MRMTVGTTDRPWLDSRRARTCEYRRTHVYDAGMRTTVEFDPDVSKEIERVRREEGRGVSDAVNTLIRRGMAADRSRRPFEPITRELGLTIDVSNVSDALDLLEGARER